MSDPNVTDASPAETAAVTAATVFAPQDAMPDDWTACDGDRRVQTVQRHTFDHGQWDDDMAAAVAAAGDHYAPQSLRH